MTTYKTVFTTARSVFHQEAALRNAPASLDITMLREPDTAALYEALADAPYLISERTGVVNADLFAHAPTLKLVLRLGSQTYDIDTDAAQAAGVQVAYWPQGSTIRVAEHTIMQMLALAKRLVPTEQIALEAGTQWGASKRTDEDTFAYNWSGQQHVYGLWGRTVGIVGFGEIGVELARRLAGWDVTLLYHKRSRLPQRFEDELGIAYTQPEDMYPQVDTLVNLLPYYPTTDLSLNADVFGAMKPTATVVSTGSGSVIDENALAEALTAGRLAGAALDTFEWEPIKADNPLLPLAKARRNVLLTPHTAAGGSAAASNEGAANYINIVNHIEGKPLRYRLA